MISQSDAPVPVAPEEISVRMKNRYSFCYILFVLINGRIMFNRKNKSKCNAWETHSKKQKYIKPTALSPFIPENKYY